MSIFKKTKREFLAENRITGMFTKEQIKILEKHDTDADDYTAVAISLGDQAML